MLFSLCRRARAVGEKVREPHGLSPAVEGACGQLQLLLSGQGLEVRLDLIRC